jgi:hypothetical protein
MKRFVAAPAHRIEAESVPAARAGANFAVFVSFECFAVEQKIIET